MWCIFWYRYWKNSWWRGYFKRNWTTHKKYGVQFEFDTLELKEAEIFFFLQNCKRCRKKKFAHELLEKYSEEELVEILNERPNELWILKE